MKSGNRTIGILGGMGPMAGCDLLRKIIDLTDSDTDNGHLRVLLDSNTNIPDRTRAILSGGEDPLPELVRSALLLEQGGADVLVMSCNTAHFFYPAICRFVHVPFLNMLDETAKQAVARGFGTVGLLATDGTIQTGVYADAFARQGVRAVAPDAAQQQEVMHLIYDGIKAGKPAFDIGPLTEILAALAAAGAEAVILGCTELPLAFAQYGVQSPLPLLDPTAVVAASAIRFVGGKLRGQPVGE